MKKTLLVSCLSAFGILFAAMTASANSVVMGFTAAQGNHSGGVDTYPYDFTLNGSGNYPLMCDSYAQHISNGESWNATTLTVDNLNAGNVMGLEFPSAGVVGYLEASYLFVEEVNAYKASNSDPRGLYNWAVWDLFQGSDVSAAALSPTDEAKVQTYLGTAVGLGGSLTPSQFSNVVIYTPTDRSAGGPQEFFGYGTPVPEPGTLALVVMGLLGVLVIRPRKK